MPRSVTVSDSQPGWRSDSVSRGAVGPLENVSSERAKPESGSGSGRSGGSCLGGFPLADPTSVVARWEDIQQVSPGLLKSVAASLALVHPYLFPHRSSSPSRNQSSFRYRRSSQYSW